MERKPINSRDEQFEKEVKEPSNGSYSTGTSNCIKKGLPLWALFLIILGIMVLAVVLVNVL